MAYVELAARSAFSFGDGTQMPEDVVRTAATLGYSAVGLCDRADLGGVIRASLEADRQGIRLVVGSELFIADNGPVTLLVRNQDGFRSLASLVTLARKRPRGRPTVTLADLCGNATGLHCLTGPADGPVASRLLRTDADGARALLRMLRSAFEDNVAIETQLHLASGSESELASRLIRLAGAECIPWVVTNAPRYATAAGRRLHDALTALHAGVDVDQARSSGLLLPNGEWVFKSPGQIEDLWAARPEGIEAAGRLAQECAFQLRWVRPPLPQFPVPPGEDDDSYLTALVLAGARERWGDAGDAEMRQIEHELGVIRRLGFAGFFLVMWDAVRFARSRNILCQGRGSAANSVVAYCLGITPVDPVRNGLLFERFLSEERTDGKTEAPDIDVDFEMHRREEVLNYVYQTYDREHAAITGMAQTFHAPSAIQDIGRALGYGLEPIRAVSKRLHYASPSEGAAALAGGLAAEHGLDLSDGRGAAMLEMLRAMDDLPRVRATHPGGFVISRDKLGSFLPIEPTTMGRTILQFDKDDLDAAGVPKFDFLGLGGLSAIRIAFDAIGERTGRALELYQLPYDDAATFDLIRSGDTVGTFQIESRAQIASILQTQPERLYDIVVQLALIRPGPIQAEFVRPYTRRRRGLEPVTYAHPDLVPALERTYGIPVFQEQAMRIAMDVGGFTAAEADELRRCMGAQKKFARLKAALEKLVLRMVGRGIDEQVARSIAHDLESFGSYGFPESHSWSFGFLAYASAFLKAHYPADFYLGILNAWPMGFYPAATLVNDARRRGVVVRGPCLRDGDWDCTLEPTDDATRPALRIGWRHIRGLGEVTGKALQQAREAGPFRSVEDVIRRAGLDRLAAAHLARAGAFEAFEPGRRRAAWEALRTAGDTLALAPARKFGLNVDELDEQMLVFADYLATGISVRGHPMEWMRRRLDRAGVLSSKTLPDARAGRAVRVAGLVVARQHPQTANGTVFLLLEDEFGFVNVIVPPDVYRRNLETINYSPFLLVRGRLERDGRVINIVGREYAGLRSPALAFQSRDYH